MRVIRINLIAGKWWLQPSQWTFSRSRWAPRVYPSLKKLIAVEKLLKENVIISLNKDKKLLTYRSLQQMRDLKIFFNNAEVAKIESGVPLDFKLPKRKMVLRFDKKSLKHLRAGYIPFVFADFLWEERIKTLEVDYHVLLWRKEGFTDISLKVLKDKSLRIANVATLEKDGKALEETAGKAV